MKAIFRETSDGKATFMEQGMNASFGQTTLIETADYNKLSNKPTINTVTVEGNKLGFDYNLQDRMEAITEAEIDEIIYGG